MLVLTRRLGERIMIGGCISVVVLEVISSNVVRLGIEAPKEVSVDREEIYLKKKRDIEN